MPPLVTPGSYSMSSLAGLEMADRRAVALETGVQSYPLVLALVGLTWTGCTKIQIRAFVVIGTFWYLISTAWMVPLIQMLTIEDSCLKRCFKRPSVSPPRSLPPPVAGCASATFDHSTIPPIGACFSCLLVP